MKYVKPEAAIKARLAELSAKILDEKTDARARRVAKGHSIALTAALSIPVKERHDFCKKRAEELEHSILARKRPPAGLQSSVFERAGYLWVIENEVNVWRVAAAKMFASREYAKLQGQAEPLPLVAVGS